MDNSVHLIGFVSNCICFPGKRNYFHWHKTWYFIGICINDHETSMTLCQGVSAFNLRFWHTRNQELFYLYKWKMTATTTTCIINLSGHFVRMVRSLTKNSFCTLSQRAACCWRAICLGSVWEPLSSHNCRTKRWL